MTSSRIRQGKCTACAIRWTWTGEPPLSAARCPKCNLPLNRTSYQLECLTIEALTTGLPRRLVERPTPIDSR